MKIIRTGLRAIRHKGKLTAYGFTTDEIAEIMQEEADESRYIEELEREWKTSQMSKEDREAAALVRQIEQRKERLKRILMEQGVEAFNEYRRNEPEEVIDLSGIGLPGIIACGADLISAILRGATITGADFSGAKLIGADLQGAIATGGTFKGTLLTGVDLRVAIFTNTDCSEARFTGADLRGAIFAKANLRNADFGGANLVGANLVGANIKGANFADALVASMRLSQGTPFPPGAITETKVISLQEGD